MNNGSGQQTFTRVVRGDNSTVLLSVNSGTGPENLVFAEPLGMLGLFDFLPLTFITDPAMAEFMMGGGPPPRPPTSRNLLNNLPVRPVETKEGCPICQSDMEIGEAAMILPCNHQFHVDCVKPWLTDNNTCPTCRFELDTDDAAYNEQLRQRRANGTNGATLPASSTQAQVSSAVARPAASLPVNPTQAQVGSAVPRAPVSSSMQSQARAGPSSSTTSQSVTLIPLAASQPAAIPARPEHPRVRVVRVESAARPRPLVTVTLDPAVVAYSARTGIPLTQLVPLLLQRGGQMRFQVDEGEGSMLPSNNAPNNGQLVRVPSEQRRQSTVPNELDQVFDAALSEFEQLERRQGSDPQPPPRHQQPVQEGRPTEVHTSVPPQSVTRRTETTAPGSSDVSTMVTAAHLQALNSHAQMIQRHSDVTRQQSNPDDHQRLHTLAMTAHADLMAAHRQFMAHFVQNRQPQRTTTPQNEARPTTLQDTMARNLRQYFGGQKKRKSSSRSESESKSRNIQLGNNQTSR